MEVDDISKEDKIVLYASEEHLNTMLPLSAFITKHHSSVSVTIISTADSSSISTVSTITYHQLPAVIPPSNLTKNPIELFFEIPRLYNPNLREALNEISKKFRIIAFVIDFFCNSAFEVSRSLNIPTYFNISTGGFGVCQFLHFPTIHETFNQDIGEVLNEVHESPGCPLLVSSDLPKALWFRKSNSYKHFLSTAQNMRRADGILCNGFDALEIRAKEALSNGLSVQHGPTPPVFFVGPQIPINNMNGGKRHECLTWLNSQPSKSVVFLCFGRRGLFSAKQLKEIAIGLEKSGHRFLWSIRNPPEIHSAADPDLDELLPEGFLERVKNRGFIIKSWAPQKEILSHKSVGGFVTHCGRSSVLESLINGVPMIGWPMYAEQRMHRVFMVEEMKVALQLREAEEGFVMSGELEKRVRELMDSFQGRELRRRVEELKVAAEVAVENGGSSVLALGKFVDSIKTN